MNIGIFQETNPVAAGNVLVGAIAKNTAPDVFVDHFTYPDAYDGRTQLHVFAGVEDIIYRYVCFESPDGSASGTIRNDFKIKPNNNAYLTRDDLYLVADLSPAFPSDPANRVAYGPDSTLIGWNWGLERVGFGTMQYGVDYVKTKAGVDTIQDDLDADGWRLLKDGDEISDSEKFVIHFLPQLSQTSTAPAKIITAIQKLIVTTSLDGSASGKAFLLAGDTGIGYFRINLPDLSTMADGEPLWFNSAGGNHITVGLFAAPGQSITWFNKGNDIPTGYTDHIYLCQCETIGLCKFSDPDTNIARWMVFIGGESVRTVGNQILSYGKLQMNTVLLGGQLISRQNYARLWEWVLSLENGILIPDSQFNNTAILGSNNQTYFINQGKFTTGDGSTTFRVPNLAAYGFQRYTLGPSGLPGAFDNTKCESHDHTMNGTSFVGPDGIYYLSRNLNQSYSGGGKDSFGRKTISPDTTLRTGRDNYAPAVLNYENVPNTTRIYPLITI